MIGFGMACVAAGGHALPQPVSSLVSAEDPKGIPVPNMPVVKTTELDGDLITEDMKIGDGYEVKPGGIVVAHYHGTLQADPTVVFDSSFERGESLGFPLAGVIPGWQKGVPGMKVGGIRRLTIPAALAYGERSPSPLVPPNSDLVFVIQLVDVMQIEELQVGEGEPAKARFVALTAYTITDQNGNVIEKHDASDPYIWVRGEYQAMALGLEGMKRGGKRKITVPAALNRTDSRFGKARPENVPVTIEVELLNLRNVPPDLDAPGC